jgi:hypothetical protein
MSLSHAASRRSATPQAHGLPGTEALQDVISTRAAYADDAEYVLLCCMLRTLRDNSAPRAGIEMVVGHLSNLREELSEDEWDKVEAPLEKLKRFATH